MLPPPDDELDATRLPFIAHALHVLASGARRAPTCLLIKSHGIDGYAEAVRVLPPAPPL